MPQSSQQTSPYNIRIDDLTSPQIANLLQEHLDDMTAISPPGCVYVLDLETLRKPDITFYSAWQDDQLAGCAALKTLTPQHAEIKSMRTAKPHLRKGVASLLIKHILEIAEQKNFKQISLETGSTNDFAPAQALYTRFGFKPTGPFADYPPNPFSLFMTRHLNNND